MRDWISGLSSFEYAFLLGVICGLIGLLANLFANWIIPRQFASYSISLVGFLGIFLVAFVLSKNRDENKN